jgi:hypothetical protein
MDRAFVSATQLVRAHTTRRVILAIACGALSAPPVLSGQVVTPKSLPVLHGQFNIHPSAREGMGGAVIAVDDTLLDPFVNPAKTGRSREGFVFISPFIHSVSGERGGGRSIPIGGGGSWGKWSATGLFTFQQLDRAGTLWNLRTADQSAFNQYLAGSISRRLSASTTVGFGAQVATLDALDGVDLLYAGSDQIEQEGNLADFRVGLTRVSPDDRELELVLVHSRNDMTHDVRFTTWQWDPVNRRNIQQQRREFNEDRTYIWGVHSEYSRPVGTAGWKLGWLGTMNRLSHPKIPNYVIQNIPRDPGTTYSFNAGVGLGKSVRGTSFAADLILEPIFAETWADAANDTAVAQGPRIAAGERTVENTFRFNNVKLRVGAGHDMTFGKSRTTIGYQAGLAVHSISYKLDQTLILLDSARTQREDWIEWTPTIGLRVRSRDVDVMYNFSVTCGPGSCGGRDRMMVIANSPGLESAGGGIIAAPSSDLFMQSGSLQVHKLTFRLPIR